MRLQQGARHEGDLFGVRGTMSRDWPSDEPEPINDPTKAGLPNPIIGLAPLCRNCGLIQDGKANHAGWGFFCPPKSVWSRCIVEAPK